MRTPLRRLLGAAISRLPEGPSEEERASARFTIACEVRRGTQAAARTHQRPGRLRADGRGDQPRRHDRRRPEVLRTRRPGALGGVRARRLPEGLERFEVAWELEPELDSPVAVAV